MAKISINGETYFTDNEVRKILGISAPTFYSWIESGKIVPPDRFNYRNWRLWTEIEIDVISKNIINRTYQKSELE